MPKYSVQRKTYLNVLEEKLLVQQRLGEILPCSRPSRLEKQAGSIPRCQIKNYHLYPTSRKCPDCRRYSQRLSALRSNTAKIARQDIVHHFYEDSINDLSQKNWELRQQNEQQAKEIEYLLQQLHHTEFLYTVCQSAITSVANDFGKEHVDQETSEACLNSFSQYPQWFIYYLCQNLLSRFSAEELFHYYTYF